MNNYETLMRISKCLKVIKNKDFNIEINEEQKLKKIIDNSFEYIQFIVELENEFQIETDSSFLIPDSIINIRDIIEIINKNLE